MFGSAQCLGFRLEHGELSHDLCYPPEETILKQVKSQVKKMAAKTVFVAAGDNHMIGKIQQALKKFKVSCQSGKLLHDITYYSKWFVTRY